MKFDFNEQWQKLRHFTTKTTPEKLGKLRKSASKHGSSLKKTAQKQGDAAKKHARSRASAAKSGPAKNTAQNSTKNAGAKQNRYAKTKGNTRKKAAQRKKAATKRKGAAGAAAPPETWWRRWVWYVNPKRVTDWWFTKLGMWAALKITGTAIGVVFAVIIGLFMYFAPDLPSPGEINAANLEQTTKFYDRTGETVLYEVFGDKNRTFVDLDKIDDDIENATIAMENRNFYDQGAGFSTFGIIRAAAYNVLNVDDGSLQGGSTITQQYVKNALLSPERTISRKIKELILSIQIEQLYSKDDILELYLNEIGYGAQAYGVQAASQMYFSKDAEELDLDEAAVLAALPQAPTYYSPYGKNTEALNARVDTVLRRMEQQGYITEEEAQKAIDSDTLAKVNDTPDAYRDITAPHFVLNVQEKLEQKYGAQEVAQGGLKVITTIDLKMQKKARKAVKNNIQNVVNSGGNNASLVASNPSNGQVLAMVGSRGFEHKQFGAYNAATARRQPGSSFKPYVYAKAFEDTEDWGAGSIMYDVRTDFGGGYTPSNFDDSFRGALPVRSALAESRNIPAIKMLYIVGMEPTLKQVNKMGITTLGNPSNYGLSLVLGAGEVRLDQHVNAYETFANGGVHHKQTKILKVTGPDGTVLQEWEKSRPQRIFSKQTAYLISDILSDDSARAQTFGYNNPNLAVPGHTVAIKTGTTDDLKDGWMMGYSQDIVAGVWTGHNDNEPMHVATSNITGPIFTQFMQNALKGKPDKPFERPDGIKSVQLDAYTGNLATDESKKTVTDIFPKWYEPSESEGLETATVNTASNRKVNGDCRPHEDYVEEVTNYGIRAEIPPDDPAFPRWNAPVQNLADRLDISKGGGIPEKQDDCSKEPEVVNMDAEDDGSGEVTITVEVDRSVDEISVRHNGDGDVGKPSKSGNTYTFTHTPVNNGDHTYQAEAINNGLYDAESVTCEDCGTDSSDPEEEGMLPEGSGRSRSNPVFSSSPLLLTRFF